MEHKEHNQFAFTRDNYRLLLVAIALVGIGFILMAGGGSDDPAVFSDAIFSTTRITIAPLMVIAGYVVGLFAIMKKSNA
ncbi:MAG: DUF3098 domain-containing protein [Flavobacteriales bacterium]|nr:DUF3098 domain-containing protein [Flavobacteriales bacterium]MCB9449729.1 DUF3098 domain-containing protein [Flavobacteriales bacterium]